MSDRLSEMKKGGQDSSGALDCHQFTTHCLILVSSGKAFGLLPRTVVSQPLSCPTKALQIFGKRALGH